MREINQPVPDDTDDALLEEARQKFVSLLDKPTVRRRAEVRRWRDTSPTHDAAYLEIEADWVAAVESAKRLADEEADEIATYLKAMDEQKAARAARRKSMALVAIMGLALISAFLWLERPNLFQNMMASHITERNERQQFTLSDGSTVLLDADSAINVSYSAGERRVRMLRGGAFFQVISSEIPFVVDAAEGEVRVLGTRFDIRMFEDGASVTLEYGSVEVTTGHAGGSTVMVPGERVNFGAQGIEQAETVDLADALAWRNGRYVFYRARLTDIVHEIERYRKGRIVIASSLLAEKRVTGSFSLANTDAALASLQASVGFRMTTVAGRLTVIGP